MTLGDVSHGKFLKAYLIAAWASPAVEEVDETANINNNTSILNADADLRRGWLLLKHVILLNSAVFWRNEISLDHFLCRHFLQKWSVSQSVVDCFNCSILLNCTIFFIINFKIWNCLLTKYSNNKHCTLTFLKLYFSSLRKTEFFFYCFNIYIICRISYKVHRLVAAFLFVCITF